MKKVPVEDVLNDLQFRVEALENMVHELGEHMAAQNHLLHVLARQIQRLAHESEIDITQRYN